MKRIKYILFVFLLLLSFNVKAEKCESKELARLKELAQKVEFDYEYKMIGDEVDFTINAVNLNDDLKVLIIKDYYSGDYRQFVGTTSGSLSGFKTGEKVVVTIKGFVENGCSGHTVLTKVVKLPYYNIYYDKEKCEGNEDFKFCKQLIDKNISENEFNKQFDAYLKAKEKNQDSKQEQVPEEKKDNTNLFFIIGGIVLLTIIIIVVVKIILERRKKNML